MDMDWSRFFLNPALVWVTIPLAAIILGGIQSLAKMYFAHQERIAMIEQGVHPGPSEDESRTDPLA